MTSTPCILVRREGKRVTLTLNRPDRNNSLDDTTLSTYHKVLDDAEKDNDIRLIVLEGSSRVFCSGMDLEAFVNGGGPAENGGASKYMDLLKRLSSSECIIVSKVEGDVTGGGVGLVAASDLVFASPNATFTLSEALWGLLPAMVMPFLIRRVGYQCAFRMTMTTQPIDAGEAHRIHLVDRVGPNIEALIKSDMPRLLRLHPKTVSDMKAYFRKMRVFQDRIEEQAVEELGRLAQDPRIRKNISDYVELGRMPWDAW